LRKIKTKNKKEEDGDPILKAFYKGIKQKRDLMKIIKNINIKDI